MSARLAQSKAGVTFFPLATVEETVRMCLTVLNRLELVKGVHCNYLQLIHPWVWSSHNDFWILPTSAAEPARGPRSNRGAGDGGCGGQSASSIPPTDNVMKNYSFEIFALG